MDDLSGDVNVVIQWWCDFEVLQVKIIFLSFHFQKNINKYYTSLLSNNFDIKKIPISCSTNVQSQNFNIHINIQHNKSCIVYKMAMGIFFYKFQKIITFERSKKTKK